MKFNNSIWPFLLALPVSCAMAAIVVRVPSLYFLIPDWLGAVMGQIFEITTQESSNDVEFLSAWLACLALISGIVLVWRFVNRALFALRK